MEIYVVGAVMFVAGALLGGWRVRKNWLGQEQFWHAGRDALEREKHAANYRYLETLRRELANLLIARSPGNMERLYFKAKQRESDMAEGGANRAIAEQSALAHRYPHFDDFDLIGTRHIVPYAQSITHEPEDAIDDRYLDISQWLAIEAYHASGGKRRLFIDDEVKVLDRVLSRERDTRLYHRIENAMTIYYFFRDKVGDDDGGFEFRDFSVSRGRREYSPEVEYWISFRNPDEHAIYSFFSDTTKTYHSYCRASSNFQESFVLDCIKASRE